MSRAAIVTFEMVYKIEFTCGVTQHHVNKTNWTHVLNKKMNCNKKDSR